MRWILSPITPVPYIDSEPMRLRLTKMPWFSGACHICFHHTPSGCCKHKFQGMHVPGACFCYLAKHRSSQYTFRCAEEGPALMHNSQPLWLRGPEAPCFAQRPWDLGTRTSQGVQQSCGLCMPVSTWSLGVTLEWDKAPFSLSSSSKSQPGKAEQQIVTPIVLSGLKCSAKRSP